MHDKTNVSSVTIKSLMLAVFTVLAAGAISSCKFNPRLQGNGEAYLQGEWQQDSVVAQSKMLNYALYRFKFTCDSFYVQINSFSKVNYGADTCMNKGQWQEYAKGMYEQRNDTLHLKGFFCNANYSLRGPGGCFRSGVYEEWFKAAKKADSVVELANTSGAVPFNIRLTQRITCNPKPL